MAWNWKRTTAQLYHGDTMLHIPRSLATLAVLASTLSVSPGLARAQASHTNFNIAAGLSLPTSRLGNDNDAGYNITAGFGMTQPGSQLGFRVEGLYNAFNQKGLSGDDNTTHAAGITLNAVYNLIPATPRQPGSLYAIGGIGYYNTREPFYNFDESQSNFGWNVGGGFRFPLSGFSAYVEARFHSVSSEPSMTFIPITFGLVF
jgi:hypothetical protein